MGINMKQVFVKKGRIITEEVAAPCPAPKMILVKTEYSCISAGTEMSSVKNSGESLPRIALKHPEYVKLGLQMLKEKGIKSTWDTVMGNYSLGAALGYSAAGVVISSYSDQFAEGDRVACMGAGYANHAGYICVPQNLAVRMPEGVSLAEASTAALGCIAMQGIRRAELQLGEIVVVCGMGILGQLTGRMAAAAGATVIVTDVDDRRIGIALKAGAGYGINPAKQDIIKAVDDITGGHGADKVILTAATDSDVLISQAFQVCRRRGTVVLVGVAGMNLKREDMYAKELELKIATSYGPGRYDSSYEEEGKDYPYGLVRFTEQRNLEAYLRLIKENKISIKDIIEEIYPVQEAGSAYEALKNSHHKPLIVLLKYSQDETVSQEEAESKGAPVNRQYRAPAGVIKVAICGAGGFAKGMHLPNLEKMKDKYSIYAIQSRTSANAHALARQYHASYATADYDEILRDPAVDMVMICTRHHLHADMSIKAMRAGKAVFVEKPAAINERELTEVIRAVRETGVPYTVGFNRRFSSYAREAKKHIRNRVNPLMISYRMNVGYLPREHWIQGEEGGGRIIGEACHILDLFAYFTESRPESVSIDKITPHNDKIMSGDNCVLTVKYQDGSVCTLYYTGLGNSGYGKEFCEIYTDGRIITIDDYKKITGYGIKVQDIRSSVSQKGQLEELESFYQAIKDGSKYTIGLDDIEGTSRLTFAAK